MVIKEKWDAVGAIVTIFLGLASGGILAAQQRGSLVSSLPNGAQIEFVRIPAGEFMMGCSAGDNECADDEKPAHMVRITRAFEIGKYEVTEAQWQAVMVDAPFVPTGGQDVWEWVSDFYDEKYYPVSAVSDPKGPATGQYRVLRGGSLVSDPARARISARSFVGLPIRPDFFGFRVVREPAH